MVHCGKKQVIFAAGHGALKVENGVRLVAMK